MHRELVANELKLVKCSVTNIKIELKMKCLKIETYEMRSRYFVMPILTMTINHLGF